MTRRSHALAAALVLGTITTTAAAQAATATASMLVTANVAAACLVTANPLPFGNYSTTAASTANTSIGVVCTTGTTYNVGLNAGTGTGASGTTRLMTQTLGANTLAYNLFSDSGLGTPWGNTVGTNTVAGTGTGLGQSLTVYGQIPSGQNAPAGAYTDTITVTLTY